MEELVFEEKNGKKIVNMKARADTPTKGLAASFIRAFESGADEIRVVSVGAGPNNQVLKARIVFYEKAKGKGIEYYTTEAFYNLTIEDKRRTGILWIIRKTDSI